MTSFVKKAVHFIYDEELLPLSRQNSANYISLTGAWLSRFGLVCMMAYFVLSRFPDAYTYSFSSVVRWCGIALYAFAAACDGLDGFVARKLNVVSRFGEIYDPHLDKIQYVTKVNGLIIDAVVTVLGGASWQLVFQVVLVAWVTQERDLTTLFHRLWALREDSQIKMSAGAAGKWRTRICFPGLLLFFFVLNPLQSVLLGWVVTCMIISVTLYSVYDYVHRYREAIKCARNRSLQTYQS